MSAVTEAAWLGAVQHTVRWRADIQPTADGTAAYAARYVLLRGVDHPLAGGASF